MRLFGGLIGGVIAGLIGALAWGGLALLTGYEIGFLAWGVGALVGIGVAVGARSGGTAAGVLALCLAIVSILGGKFLAVSWIMKKELAQDFEFAAESLERLEDDEYVISFIADDVAWERERNGEDLAWPPGSDPSEAAARADYPLSVWREAEGVWDDWTAAERESFRTTLAEDYTVDMEGMEAFLIGLGFLFSFGLFDLVFIGLAVATAYKVASSAGRDDEALVFDEDQPSAPAMFTVAGAVEQTASAAHEQELTSAAPPSEPPHASPPAPAPPAPSASDDVDDGAGPALFNLASKRHDDESTAA